MHKLDCPNESLLGVSNECTRNCPNRAPSHEAELREALRLMWEDMNVEQRIDTTIPEYIAKARAALQKAGVV